MIFDFIHIANAATEAATHAVAEAPHAAEAAEQVNILNTLGINGGLFFAQLVNFAIILFVLWKWVLPVVGKKLTERTERIEKALNDAERVEKEKMEFETWRNAEMTKAKQEASAIITKSQTEAGKAKDEIMAQAKLDQQKLVEQTKKQIESEKNAALQSAKGELADLVTMATEKIIREKMSSEKDRKLVKEMISTL